MLIYKLYHKPTSNTQQKYIALTISFSFENDNIRLIWKEIITILFTLQEKKDFTISLKITDNKAVLKFHVQNNKLLFEVENNPQLTD